jgi:MerR family copper efflux transcriptional regulator
MSWVYLSIPGNIDQEMSMEAAISYSISEAAEALKLSPKTIRRYIKSGKLPSVKVPSKFGEEYRITEIPEALRQEAEAQIEAQAKTDVAGAEPPGNQLDAKQLYQENIRLAAQLGAATERIRQLEERLQALEPKLLQAPKPIRLPFWKRLLRRKS